MNQPQLFWKLQFGPLWVGILGQGDTVLDSIVGQSEQEVENQRRTMPQANHATPVKEQFRRIIKNILLGRRKMPLQWLEHHRLTPFQASVLRFTRDVPWGRTVAYHEVADGIKRPHSARAVGQALRANPLPLFIPCHRVIGSQGDLRGYGGPRGKQLKRAILDLEQMKPEALPVVWTH